MKIVNNLQILATSNTRESDQVTANSNHHSRGEKIPNSADRPPQRTIRANKENRPQTMTKRAR